MNEEAQEVIADLNHSQEEQPETTGREYFWTTIHRPEPVTEKDREEEYAAERCNRKAEGPKKEAAKKGCLSRDGGAAEQEFHSR